MLDAKIKLKKDSMQNASHKLAIKLEDLKKLKDSEILSHTQPLSLLRNVCSIFHFFGDLMALRAREVFKEAVSYFVKRETCYERKDDCQIPLTYTKR